ncbi:MAG: AraC family transcriptional regulator [Hespellia sp.]|nr:AraC family transcriptional regulator [Hespellia sp.]
MKKSILRMFQNDSDTKNSRSFYATLLLSFFVVAIGSTLLLSICLTVGFFRSISSSTQNYNEQLLSQTNYSINQIDESADRLTASLLSNNRISAFLSLTQADSIVSIQASQEINKQLMILPYVDSIFLYNANLNLLYSSKNGFQQSPDLFDDSEIISRLDDPVFLNSYTGTPVPYYPDSDSASAQMLTYYVFDRYNHVDDRQNTIIINVNVSMLTDSINAMKELTSVTESNFILLDQDRHCLAGILNSPVKNEQDFIDSARKKFADSDTPKSSFLSVDGKTYFLTHTNQNVYGWHLLSCIPTATLFQDLLRTALLSSLILIGVLLICFIICRQLAHRLNEPVEMITHLISEPAAANTKTPAFETKEFQMISSTVTSLQDHNQKLRFMQQRNNYSLTQSFLNELVMNQHLDSPAFVKQKLKDLNLSYLNEEKLCIAVFKIDRYQQFFSEHNADELWAIRFSVVNIIEELASDDHRCNAFSRDDDKFVLLMACGQNMDLVDFEDKLLLLLQSIQNNIETYLHITVTAAYSTVLQKLDKLSVAYKNVESALRLKMKYGHNAIIDSYQMEEIPTDSFKLLYRPTSQLIDRLLNNQLESAWDAYERLTENLFYYDYNEITSTLIHLAYNIYERVSEKYPMLKDIFTEALKDFLADLGNAEISDDVQQMVHTFFETVCSCVEKMKQDPNQQTSALVAERVTQIIQEKYMDPALCLCSIAEEIGLSSNYTGHIFKQCTQKSVAQYLLELRMDKVAEYLQNTSLPLSKILEKVGLEKNNYFYTRFKNYFGMPLGEYRQKFQHNNE